jgi:solute carrier family 25 thiamine pyrophosphate transporter 19
MVKASSEAASRPDPLDARYAPSGFFNMTSTAKEKVLKKRKKRGMGPITKKKHPSISQFYLIFASSIASKLVFMPLERMKIILQVNHLSATSNNKPSGALSLSGNIIKNQGISSFYRGAMPMIYMNTFKMMTNIVFYDRFKRYFMPAGDAKYTGFDYLTRKISSSLLAGTLTIALSYPFELLFTRITADMNGVGQKRLYYNTFDCFNSSMIYSESSYRVFYSGSLVALASTLPMTLIALPVYDMLKPVFESMVTPVSGKLDYVNDYNNIISRFGAGTISGMIAMAAVYPLDTIKKCMQVIGTRGYGSIDRSIATATSSIYKAYGIRGFYRGIHLSMIKALPAVYLQFILYDHLRSKVTYEGDTKDGEEFVPKKATKDETRTSIITGETSKA